MIERAHLTIGNMIRQQRFFADPDDNTLSDADRIDSALSAIGFAMRATVHTTTGATPTQLVFGRDHMLNTQFIADWNLIKQRKQRVINQNNARENAKRKQHTYHVGDKVKVLQKPSLKFGSGDQYSGPYTITNVNENGTARLRRDTANGGAIYETWNIRNISPYHE